MSDHPNLSVALSAAEAGFPVVPCGGNKRPAVGIHDEFDGVPWSDVVPDWLYREGDHGGFLRATLNPDYVRQYWDAFPGATPAVVVPPGRVVVDVDNLEDFPADLLHALHSAANLVVRTPGGGLHLHFGAVDGLDLREALYVDQPRPENENQNVHVADWITATKGYVFPPGARRRGKEYEVVRGELGASPATFPDDCIDEIRAMYHRSLVRECQRREPCERRRFGDPAYAVGRRRINPEDVAGMSSGGRHDAMLRGTLQDYNEGISRPEAWIAALEGADRNPREAAREVGRAIDGAETRMGDPWGKCEPGSPILRECPSDAPSAPQTHTSGGEAPMPVRHDAGRLSGFLAAVKDVGCEIVGVQPANYVGIIWPEGGDPEPLEVRTPADSRLLVALREGALQQNYRPFELRVDTRRAFYDEAARRNPRTYEHLVDEARAAIEATIRELPAGRGVVHAVLARSGVLNTTQSGAQARPLEKLTTKIFRELGWRPTGHTIYAYLVYVAKGGKKILLSAADHNRNRTGGKWEHRAAQPGRRGWSSPDGWQPEVGIDEE